jgi:hypothetical protein
MLFVYQNVMHDGSGQSSGHPHWHPNGYRDLPLIPARHQKIGNKTVKAPVKKESNSITFNEAQLGQVTVEFKKDSEGQIEFVLITTGRTNKIKFRKL